MRALATRHAGTAQENARHWSAGIRLGRTEVLLHPEGVAYFPEAALLAVADLHLEKATAFAARGQMLPPYETLETLRRLLKLVEAFEPRTLLLLGDSFHSGVEAIGREGPARALIDALGERAGMLWVAGNHDPLPPCPVPGRWLAELTLGDLVFRHAPVADGACEVVGHLHPTGRLPTRAGSQRRKCFVASGRRLLLPAFGALTGGLDVSDEAIAGWFGAAEDRAFLMCRDRLAEVPLAALR